jgi:hypothetical protein
MDRRSEGRHEEARELYHNGCMKFGSKFKLSLPLDEALTN